MRKPENDEAVFDICGCGHNGQGIERTGPCSHPYLWLWTRRWDVRDELDCVKPIVTTGRVCGAWAALLMGFLAGCQSPDADSPEAATLARVQSLPSVREAQADAVGPRPPPSAMLVPEIAIEVQAGKSLLEQKIARLVERQTAYLERLAIAENDVDRATLEQRVVEICREYEAIIAENPYELLPYIVYGKLLRQIGERERAHEMFQRANAIDTKIPVIKQQIGNYFVEEGLYPQALLFFMAAIELAPHEAVYHYSFGELFYIYGDDFVADGAYTRQQVERLMLDGFRQAALLAPDNPDFQFRYGEAFHDTEKPDWFVALAHWEVFQERAQNQTQADAIRLHRARVMLQLGWKSEARELLEQVSTPTLEDTKTKLLLQID